MDYFVNDNEYHSWIKVDNISEETNVVDVLAVLAPIGKYSSYYKDVEKQCIYVRMENYEIARKLSGIEVKGGKKAIITVVPHVATVKVYDIPPNTNDDDIHETFSRFGCILKASIDLDIDGMSKGKATVIFTKIEAAKAAVQEYIDTGLFLKNTYISLVVKPIKKNELVNVNNENITNDIHILKSAREFYNNEYKKIDNEYQKTKKYIEKRKNMIQEDLVMAINEQIIDSKCDEHVDFKEINIEDFGDIASIENIDCIDFAEPQSIPIEYQFDNETIIEEGEQTESERAAFLLKPHSFSNTSSSSSDESVENMDIPGVAGMASVVNIADDDYFMGED